MNLMSIIMYNLNLRLVGFYDDVCVELFELSKWGLGWVAE